MTATFEIRVQPKAKRNSIEVYDDGAVRVRVTAPPDRGKANDAVVKLLAKKLQVPRSVVSIVRGQTARNKVVRVEGKSGAEIVHLLSRSS